MGLDPKTGQVPADPEQEARLAMDGVKTTVEAAGLSIDEVVSVQVFCTDLKLYETLNAVIRPISTDTSRPGVHRDGRAFAVEDTK